MEKDTYFVDRLVCLFTRKQNRKFIQRNAKKKGFNTDIQNCKGSFYENLKEMIQRYRMKKENILFYDDRLQFLLNPKGLFEPPIDWEVLFLNGKITKLGGKTDSKYYTKGYVENSTCIVLNKTVKDKIKHFSLSEFEESLNAMKCYVLKNSFAVENDKAYGLEKIETPEQLDQAPIEYTKDETGFKLRMSEISNASLPKVSLITPINSITPKQRKLFFFTVMNFYKLDYPKDKLEWIIADDTPSSELEQITDLLPGQKDQRIKVIKCDVQSGRVRRLSIGKKLNICANYAETKYIIHFFEFNYYPEDTIKNRVKALINNSETKMCVGSTKVGVYNFIKNSSHTLQEKDPSDHPVILYEPSLAYQKTFWELQPFHEYLLNDHIKNICVIPWSDSRYHLLLDLPYDFTCTKLEAESEIDNSIDISENWNEKLRETLLICKGDYLSCK